ncbi:hypothetical protein A3C37_00060 [Candidatus Peribacteria bacterium RIFCSPHIGHO2_02_FULL_53_20]|nr:MAG: hypothetical protein A3C37_00060 [Candidatus Peribacteria bacterium RIFCSPHIGHO2_02_FULL_53_20]
MDLVIVMEGSVAAILSYPYVILLLEERSGEPAGQGGSEDFSVEQEGWGEQVVRGAREGQVARVGADLRLPPLDHPLHRGLLVLQDLQVRSYPSAALAMEVGLEGQEAWGEQRVARGVEEPAVCVHSP